MDKYLITGRAIGAIGIFHHLGEVSATSPDIAREMAERTYRGEYDHLMVLPMDKGIPCPVCHFTHKS